MSFELLETTKIGGNWAQEVAVVRNGVVYLRLVGDGTVYRVMTATAGEYSGRYRACHDKERLWEAATQLARANNCVEEVSTDGKGRIYIRLFHATHDDGLSDDEFTKEVEGWVSEFFAIYDGLGEAKDNSAVNL